MTTFIQETSAATAICATVAAILCWLNLDGFLGLLTTILTLTTMMLGTATICACVIGAIVWLVRHVRITII